MLNKYNLSLYAAKKNKYVSHRQIKMVKKT